MLLNGISYATSDYKNSAAALAARCFELGFNSFKIYEPIDISIEFQERHRDSLSKTRGAGYWIWKPYILEMAAKALNPSEIVMYADCGVLPLQDSSYYIDLVNDGRIHVWALEGQKIKQWTEPVVLKELGQTSQVGELTMVMGGVVLSKVSELFLQFLELWRELCSNPAYLHPDAEENYTKPEGLVWHRHDQSILSIIVANHPEWFHVHSKTNNCNPTEEDFSIHRRKNIRWKTFVFSFPKSRAFRQKVSAKMPQRFRSSLRKLLYFRQRKKISSVEIKSIQATL
jgi:hypothetical protein